MTSKKDDRPQRRGVIDPAVADLLDEMDGAEERS
jgi:hypothetical protein